MHVRVCRDCGEEFRPEVTVCSDCGGSLVDRDDDASAPAEAAVRSESPQLSREDLVAVAQGQEAGDIEPAARILGEAGVAFAVSGAVHQFRLLVDPTDLARARAALALDAPPPAEAPLAECPACGAALGPAVAECPECGLALSGPEPGE